MGPPDHGGLPGHTRRSPHQRYYLVDHTGTHTLPKSIGVTIWATLDAGIDLHRANQAIDYDPAA